MTWDSSRTSPARGRLARHLGRLQQHLDSVGEQVRQAVANAVGRTVAEVVGETVYDALLPHESPSYASPRSSAGYYGPSSSQREWDDPGWAREYYPSSRQDPYDDYDDPYQQDEVEPEDAPSEHISSRGQRWRRAVAAGVQATAWWLRRHPGQASLFAALAVGAIASFAVLVGHVSGIASVVMSALGLAYLLDLLRFASTLLG